MYTCVVCVHVCMRVCMLVCILVCMCIHVCMHIRMHVCYVYDMCMCMCMLVYCVCACVHVYVHMCTCTYISFVYNYKERVLTIFCQLNSPLIFLYVYDLSHSMTQDDQFLYIARSANSRLEGPRYVTRIMKITFCM